MPEGQQARAHRVGAYPRAANQQYRSIIGKSSLSLQSGQAFQSLPDELRAYQSSAERQDNHPQRAGEQVLPESRSNQCKPQNARRRLSVGDWMYDATAPATAKLVA